MLTGRRYGGTDALAAGIVSAALSEDELLPSAIAAAAELAPKAGPTLQTIRKTMYRPILDLLVKPANLDIPGL
jgi:enoyl-CoA hydratase/carnithine racemase